MLVTALVVGLLAAPPTLLLVLASDDDRRVPRNLRRRRRIRLTVGVALVLPLVAVIMALPQAPGDWFGLSQALLLVLLLVPLALMDLLSLTVDARLVLLGLALRLGSVALGQPEGMLNLVLGLFTGAGALAFVGFAYAGLRGREGLGDGDVGMMGLIGAFVGWQGVFPVLGAAALAGLLIGGAVLWRRGAGWSAHVPFAPFLALGALVVYALGLWRGLPGGWLPG
jgi:leader peptidase (prepilin peptidase)/N-methyltransferase